MNTFCRVCLWLLALLICGNAFGPGEFVFAGIHYVSPNGDNNRSKNQSTNRSTPWRTLQHAVNQLSPGDQIRVLDGTYTEHVWIPRSGQVGAWVSVQAENQGGAKIVGSLSGDSLSYVLIKDMDVANSQGNFVQSKGISFTRSHHITIRGNRVHDCTGGGIGVDQSDSIVIDWNLVYDNAFYDPGQHSGISVYQPQRRGPQNDRYWGVVVRNNTSYGNKNLVNNPLFGRPTDGNGIVMDDFQNKHSGGNGVVYDRPSVAENNLCFDNGGQGVHCYQSNNIYIRNNTCSNNLESFDFGGEVAVVDSTNILVYNNVLNARNNRFAALQYQSSGYWFAYNLINGPVQSFRSGRGNVYADPQFKPGTFRLQATSPGVDAALTQNGLFPFDAEGNPRLTNGALDIGAMEFAWWLD